MISERACIVSKMMSSMVAAARAGGNWQMSATCAVILEIEAAAPIKVLLLRRVFMILTLRGILE